MYSTSLHENAVLTQIAIRTRTHATTHVNQELKYLTSAIIAARPRHGTSSTHPGARPVPRLDPAVQRARLSGAQPRVLQTPPLILCRNSSQVGLGQLPHFIFCTGMVLCDPCLRLLADGRPALCMPVPGTAAVLGHVASACLGGVYLAFCGAGMQTTGSIRMLVC